MSHGAGGNWDTHYGIAHFLASHGYIVLCLEHIGSNTTVLKKSMHFMQNINDMIHDSNEAAGRPKDVSFAINQLEEWNKSNPFLKEEIDLQNIGLLGHSYGAYTTMVIAGIRPTLDKNKSDKGLVSGLNDDRVKACVALSPQGANPPFFKTESFVTLKTPLLGISGTKDQLFGGYPPIDRYNSFSLWPENNGNHRFIWLQNAAHNDFSDNDGSGTKNFYSPNRKDVSKIVRAASLMFFNYHLKNDQNSIYLLSTSGLTPYLSNVINGVEVRSK
jgi:predicted dienelactone hydrolase